MTPPRHIFRLYRLEKISAHMRYTSYFSIFLLRAYIFIFAETSVYTISFTYLFCLKRGTFLNWPERKQAKN